MSPELREWLRRAIDVRQRLLVGDEPLRSEEGWKHGQSGYRHHGCRCRICQTATIDARQARRARCAKTA